MTTQSTSATTTLEREVRIDASPESVYGYFVEPAAMCRWMGVDAELEPHPGGIFRVNVDGQHTARGEFVELVPHERVVFTWGWEGEDIPLAPGESTVEVTLTPDGAGTLLRLVHTDLAAEGPGSVSSHAHGWEHYLERLGVAAGTGDAGPDPWIKA